MPPRLVLSTLSPSFQRRLPRTPLRRRQEPDRPLRPLSTPSRLLVDNKPKKHNLAPSSAPPSTAIAALLSRLSLGADPALYSSILACLTHPSYRPTWSSSDRTESSPSSTTANNEVLSNLGNALMGIFASEHVAHRYPLLPTEALKNAVTAYVGPKACVSVARELGIGVQGGGNTGAAGQGPGSASAGIPLRCTREWSEKLEVEGEVPVARRFRKYTDKGKGQGRLDMREIEDEDMLSEEGGPGIWSKGKREMFDDIVAGVIKAFIGLVYQERGIHAARDFVHGHFLSRHLDISGLFQFKNPKHVLSSVVRRHLVDTGVSISSGAGRIEARLLASTGLNTSSPIFNIGLFLPSGLRLAEGNGSSLAMAEPRAAVNALHSLYLVRGGTGQKAGNVPPSAYASPTLSTSAHNDYPLNENGLLLVREVERYLGSGFGGLESNVESSRRRAREGIRLGSRRTNAI